MFRMKSTMSLNDKEIIPDTPEMRSVLISSAPPSRLGVRFEKESVLKQSKVAVVPKGSSSSWKPASVPQVPDDYRLSRSHILVKDVDGCQIANRIAECLRKESLTASFQENQATVETPCHTKFDVRIFQRENQFLVEIQRRSGCPIKCQRYCRAILRAAKGDSLPKTATPSWRVPSFLFGKQEVDSDGRSDLAKAFDLVQEEKYDLRLLGMEALIGLCKKHTMEDKQLAVIFQYIRTDPSPDDYDAKFVAMLRRDAVTVLANALKNHKVASEQLTPDLVKVLIADLVNEDLHVALQAARCLTTISQSSDWKEKICGLGASSAVAAAKLQASHRHQDLENELQLLQLELS